MVWYLGCKWAQQRATVTKSQKEKPLDFSKEEMRVLGWDSAVGKQMIAKKDWDNSMIEILQKEIPLWF